MPETYLTVAGPVDAQIEVRRSRFRARLERVETEDAARAVVERARKEHWDARHHCSAFVLGPDAMTERSSDDGEPAGTAGAPMLEVLRGRGLTDVVCVVTRWFGGTLLGTGGLIRAYGDSVRAACDAATVLERRLVQQVRLGVDHADAGRVEASLRARGVHVEGTEYAARATLLLAVPPGERGHLDGTVAELTSGAGELTDGEQVWVDAPR